MYLNSNYESEFSEIKIDTFLISKLLAVFFKTNIKNQQYATIEIHINLKLTTKIIYIFLLMNKL